MNTKPIYVFARWQVKEGRLQTVLTLLAEVAQKSPGSYCNNLSAGFVNNFQITLFRLVCTLYKC